ncbi:MAG: rRNA large subunit methyltransferase I, partial [Clostridia bacterium]|nr:rRNA large subunit methyltransferase I [Clostridia bacterium]
MAKAILRPTREARVRSGHPWVFSSDIDRVQGEFEPGDVVNVESSKGTFLGQAFYNPNSQIALRMLTYRDVIIDREFFIDRIRTAWEYRQRFCDINSCRLVFSESDFLPGLIVDTFADTVVVQSLSLGIEKWKDAI